MCFTARRDLAVRALRKLNLFFCKKSSINELIKSMFLPRPVRLRARDDVVDALVEVREELGEGPRGHLPGLGLDIDAEVLRGALPLRLAFHLACSALLSRKGNEI